MSALLTQAFLSTLIFGAVTAGMPLLLAGLGEQISEKAGILNIGIEGMMLAGAYGGFVAAYTWDSFSLGFLAGAAAGMAVASLMAIFCVRLSLNQIIVGIALTLSAEGLTALLQYFQLSRYLPASAESAGARHSRPRKHPGHRPRIIPAQCGCVSGGASRRRGRVAVPQQLYRS